MKYFEFKYRVTDTGKMVDQGDGMIFNNLLLPE